MEFEKREEYSIDKNGSLFQISQDEFVHCSASIPRRFDPYSITWMKGNKRTEQQIKYDTPFGVVGNSFFFEKDKIIKKADLKNDQIVISHSVSLKIENEINVLFKPYCLHYFIERDNNTNASFAISINEDFRFSINLVKFNVSIEELKKYHGIHVHDKFLFGITLNENSSSIHRYKSDSEEHLEKKELPWMFGQSVIFNNWIFYLTFERDLISLNMNDFSYEIMKTNLLEFSNIAGIDENGMVNANSFFTEYPIHLFAANLPEKYMTENVRIQSAIELIDTKKKSIEELERIVENEKNKKEELLNAKNLLEKRLKDKEKNEEELEKRNTKLEVEMKELKLKYDKLHAKKK